MCAHVRLGIVVVVGCSAYAPSHEEVLVQQHPLFCLESHVWSENYRVLIRVSILVGK